jgi:hypothetical protein
MRPVQELLASIFPHSPSLTSKGRISALGKHFRKDAPKNDKNKNCISKKIPSPQEQ